MAIVTITTTTNQIFDLSAFDAIAMTVGTPDVATATRYLEHGRGTFEFFGTGFTYDANGRLADGQIATLDYKTSPDGSGPSLYIEGLDLAARSLLALARENDVLSTFRYIFQSDDQINGSDGVDRIWGAAGSDTIFGGNGNDVIAGSQDGVFNAQPDGSNYLRGDNGTDLIHGGPGFDDINGNKGNDTCYGGDGDDWVVGGQDNDLLHGDNGFDIVYGNLGNDTIYGDNGDDWVRGGQGDDQVFGGDGKDWLWGDRGNDTVTGGAGADVFHTFIGAGSDRVTDLNYGEGDRVVIDGGATYALAQVGADVVVTLAENTTMTLVGVTLSSLPNDWISVGP